MFVDGADVPVRVETIKLRPDQPRFGEFGPESRWFIHDVPFKRNQTRIVINRYLAPHGGSVSPEAAFSTFFSYTLHTGSTWKGKIGQADIVVDFASGLTWKHFLPDPKVFRDFGYEPPSESCIMPAQYTRRDDGFSWTLANIEPKPGEDDIHIGFYRDMRQEAPNRVGAKADSWLDAAEYEYPPAQAFDGNIETAWAEGAAGSGIGQSITATFKKPRKIAEVRILPGYVKKPELFSKYSRPKAATIRFSGGTVKRIQLDDDARVQYFTLDMPVTASWAKFTIDDVYKGSVGPDTYITEIEFGPGRPARGPTRPRSLPEKAHRS